jgi:hypothetical protein
MNTSTMTKVADTQTTTTTKPSKWEAIFQGDLREVLTSIFGAKQTADNARKEANAAQKAYEGTLVQLPVIYTARATMSVKEICATADLDYDKSGQSVLYYIRGGRVMAQLANDGKTSPAQIMGRINRVARANIDLTIAQVDACIDMMVDEGGLTWADFLDRIDAICGDKTIANAVKKVVDNIDELTDAQADALANALKARK